MGEVRFDNHHEAIQGTVLLQRTVATKVKLSSEALEDKFEDVEGEYDAVPPQVCLGEDGPSVRKAQARQRQSRTNNGNLATKHSGLASERSHWANFHFDISVVVVIILAMIWYQHHVLFIPSMLSVRFEPGSLGLRIDPASGVVNEVKAETQAACKGVKVNMVLEQVNGSADTKEFLDLCVARNEGFAVVFRAP